MTFRLPTHVSSVLVLAMAAVAAAPAAFAQAGPPTGQSGAHHPPMNAGPKAGDQARPGTGMMNQGGMMGSQGNMMGQRGMMGDEGCMMDGGMMGENAMMRGDRMRMMSMMRGRMAMMSAESGMMAAYVEGRIAEFKTALKITDAQMPQWNRFAEAVRGVGKTMGEMHEQMKESGQANTPPERLERRERLLSAQLASVKNLKEALQPLYASLGDDQKKIADKVMMIGPMGMM